jgi:1-pyrroline-5-carboxylate dehydrogenase
MRGVFMLEEYRSLPYLDFSTNENRELYQRKGIDLVRSQLGRRYTVNGKSPTEDESIVSHNPSKPSEIIGVVPKFNKNEIDVAIEDAWDTFQWWSSLKFETRAEYLLHASEILKSRIMEFSAIQTLEIGKNYLEAYGETAELIDYLEYYARLAIDLDNPHYPLTPIKGERNVMNYYPLGVGAVIAPWNFPLAILGGMTLGAAVAGNTIILKPSSDSPIIAIKFMELLEEAGIPKGVVTLITGSGSEVGNHLASHPRIRFINFTGSRDVGLSINELGSKNHQGQKWIKRINLEMGGKDFIMISEKFRNIDKAVDACVKSGFGFQGQKCSAGSRNIVHRSHLDAYIEKIQEKVSKIKIGNVENPDNYLGPVINESAYNKILEYIKIGIEEDKGRLICGGHAYETSDRGWYIEPTVILVDSDQARIAQEEIFGPVITVIPYGDKECDNEDGEICSCFEEGIDIANGTDYGLTGAIFTEDPLEIEIAKEALYCGNLYINRGCTGALVGVQPFGGYNMSGTNTKAGGFDYIKRFVEEKCISLSYKA